MQVRRLHGFSGTFEAWLAAPDGLARWPKAAAATQLVLLCVHAHNRFVGDAALPAVRTALGNPPTTLVSLPCCNTFNPQKDLGRPPDVVRPPTPPPPPTRDRAPQMSISRGLEAGRQAFEDLAIFSACRAVNIWNWATAGDSHFPARSFTLPGLTRPFLPSHWTVASRPAARFRRAADRRAGPARPGRARRAPGGLGGRASCWGLCHRRRPPRAGGHRPRPPWGARDAAASC
jgi:hypothetical protein